MFPLKKASLFALALLGLSALSYAQIVSASLEYSSTAPVKIFINGIEIKNPESADEHLTDFALISSVDGSLPLGAFKYGQPNVLAFAQKNLMRHPSEIYMLLSYCLTLRYANGELVHVTGKPENGKCLFVPQSQTVPSTWVQASFDDAQWKRPQRVGLEGAGFALAELPDPAGAGVLPFLARDFTGHGQMGDNLYFRQVFSLPSRPGAVRIYPYQAAPKRGDKPAFALIPDRACASLGNLEISLALPQGLEPLASPTTRWEAAGRKLTWDFASPAKFTALNLASVVDNQGFESPQVALGPWRANRAFANKRMLGEDYWHSTAINSGTSAWYKMSAPAFTDGPTAPVILGVVFQSQLVPGGRKGALSGEGVDDILLNYSVDGSQQGSLKQDANLSRYGGPVGIQVGRGASSSIDCWINGYYVADTDRNWTWKDLANLKVHLRSVQHGQKHRSQLLSCIASVRYYQPADIAPRFYTQVTEATRKTLHLAAAVRSLQGNGDAVGSLDLNVNP
jgi:hypothetical protein